jgi:hypothetical protein
MATRFVVARKPSRRKNRVAASFLFGGGGNAETLLSLDPLLRQAWQERSLPPLLVGFLGVPGFCFYLDAPAWGDVSGNIAVGHSMLGAVREQFAGEASRTRAGLVGVSKRFIANCGSSIFLTSITSYATLIMLDRRSRRAY